MDDMNILYRYIPKPILRYGIKRLCQQRLNEQAKLYQNHEHEQALITQLSQSPIALSTDIANNQHYQVPTEFFRLVLGPYLKYSCCFWDENTTALAEAEENMLALYCQRARLEDGMHVLDLGCGWGSLTLYLAKHYPNMTIHALSNSKTQRRYIEQQAQILALKNITVHTADINDFDTEHRFDVVISIEMFEHIRNYKQIFERINTWLKPNGLCFVHHFCHKTYTYPFTLEEDNNWMAKYFFTGGLMLSQNLLEHFLTNMTVVEKWNVNGLHYHKTCEAWLTNHQTKRDEIIQVFAQQSSNHSATLQWKYWQIFFLACSELFGFNHGNEWFVRHYLFEK